MNDIDEDMVAGGTSRKPRNPRVKQPSEQSRPWIVRALEKVLCMGKTLHSENYAAYEERHAILTNQSRMMAHMQIPNPPPPPPAKIPFAGWNNGDYDWSIDVPEDVDLDEDGNPINPNQ